MNTKKNLFRVLSLVLTLALMLGALTIGASAATSETINKYYRDLTDLDGITIGRATASSDWAVSGVSNAIWGVDDNEHTTATIIVSLVPGVTAPANTLPVTLALTQEGTTTLYVSVTGGAGESTISYGIDTPDDDTDDVTYIIKVQTTEGPYTGTNCTVSEVSGEGVDTITFSGSGTSSDPYTGTASAEVTGYPYTMSLRIIPDGSAYTTYESFSYAVLSTSDNDTDLNNYVGTYFLATFPASGRTLRFSVTNGHGDTTYYAITLSAKASTGDGSASIYAYLPAPGQFTNEGVTSGGWGDAYTNANNGTLKINTTTGVSLGFYGGYLVYKFDDPVFNNVKNPYGADFIVYGNGFWANSEPGHIQVSQNGEDWYDIAGSQYYTGNTEYASITYTNPNVTQDQGYTTPASNYGTRAAVTYSLNGTSGTVSVNPFHNHSWWPLYANYFKATGTREDLSKYNVLPFIRTTPTTISNSSVATALTFTGMRLINVNTKNTGDFLFGYADAHGNYALGGNLAYNPYAVSSVTSTATYNDFLLEANYAGGQASGGDPIDISWAVQPAFIENNLGVLVENPDAGKPVTLTSIQYVRIYTGAALNNGINGELSTEVCGIATVSGEGGGEAQNTPEVTLAVDVLPNSTYSVPVTVSNMGNTPESTIKTTANNNDDDEVFVTVTDSSADFIYVNGVAATSGIGVSVPLTSGSQTIQIICQTGTRSPYVTTITLN